MPRKKNVTPKTLLQVEVPIPMAGALDLVAQTKGVSRAWLVRAILSEYLEIKFGPDLRDAMVKWQRYGADVMNTFLKEAVPALKDAPAPEVERAENEGMPSPPDIEPGRAITTEPEEHKSARTRVEESLMRQFVEERGLEAPVTEDDGTATPEYFPRKFAWERD